MLGISLPCISPAPPELESMIEAKVDEIYRAATNNNGTTSTSTGAAMPTGQGRKTEVTVSFCKERIKRTWYSKNVEWVAARQGPYPLWGLTYYV